MSITRTSALLRSPLLVAIGMLTSCIGSWAQETEPTLLQRINAQGSTVVVDQPQGLDVRVIPITITNAEGEAQAQVAEDDNAETPVETRTQRQRQVGYRVQVYADNNARTAKAEARQRERAISQQFPQWSTYVTYASPFWRLRVGDFRADYEAEKAAADIKRAFPAYAREIRVVRDRVTVRN